MMTPGRTGTCALALPLNAVAIPRVQRLPGSRVQGGGAA